MSITAPTSEATASPKATYRITNWPAYDRALVARGDITFWFDQEAIAQHWTPPPTGKRGAPWRYSDWAIQMLLVLKQVFHLPYRALEGWGRSLMRLMGLDLPIPDHTHLSRRVRALVVQIPRQERHGPIHVVVDATGLKVFGEGEWQVRQHGAGKRRTWLKVHLAVDADAKDVIGVEVTTVAWADGEVFGDLVNQMEGTIEQIDADGAYTPAKRMRWRRNARPRWSSRPAPMRWRGTRIIRARRPRSRSRRRVLSSGRKTPAITIAASPKTPCTASSNSSGWG